MKGLLGRDSLPAGRAILLTPCNSIHTVMMRFSIDVAFLSSRGEVLRILTDIPPNRLVFGGWHARSAMEMQSGRFDWSLIHVGEILTIEE